MKIKCSNLAKAIYEVRVIAANSVATLRAVTTESETVKKSSIDPKSAAQIELWAQVAT